MLPSPNPPPTHPFLPSPLLPSTPSPLSLARGWRFLRSPNLLGRAVCCFQRAWYFQASFRLKSLPIVVRGVAVFVDVAVAVQSHIFRRSGCRPCRSFTCAPTCILSTISIDFRISAHDLCLLLTGKVPPPPTISGAIHAISLLSSLFLGRGSVVFIAKIHINWHIRGETNIRICICPTLSFCGHMLLTIISLKKSPLR